MAPDIVPVRALSSKMRAREGDFVETSDGLFFDVKGLVHPPDRIVAYLRYYPNSRGARLRNGLRYAKVYELSQRHSLVRSKWPQYLYHDEAQGRDLQGVPKDDVLKLHKPEHRLTAILHSRHRDMLETLAARLIEILTRRSRLPSVSFGISGSLLVGLHQRHSDIDVIVYGEETASRVHGTLNALLEEDECFHRYREHDLKRLYTRRGLQNAIGFKDFARQESRKVLQGRFMDHDYFIRCVKKWREVTEVYGDAWYQSKGRCMVSARVVDDEESLLTPCRYLLEHVHILAGPVSRTPREVVSFRGRFAEQARTGERIVARGRLESVQSGESRYSRLVVGEGRTDVLRTVG